MSDYNKNLRMPAGVSSEYFDVPDNSEQLAQAASNMDIVIIIGFRKQDHKMQSAWSREQFNYCLDPHNISALRKTFDEIIAILQLNRHRGD